MKKIVGKKIVFYLGKGRVSGHLEAVFTFTPTPQQVLEAFELKDPDDHPAWRERILKGDYQARDQEVCIK
jgi:hypothetical protein